MAFDMNPADENIHGECRHEIESLQSRLDESLGREAKLREALEFYADKNNWTNHEDWPLSDGSGSVVLSRDSKKRDMTTPGWQEAQEALASPGLDIGKVREAVKYAVENFDLPMSEYSGVEKSAIAKLNEALQILEGRGE